jgi:xanthine dehydrogenase small subunit
MSTEPVASPASRPIRFVRRGEIVSLSNVPPSRTLLDLLREDLACTGTKEGCGEGDCGACTVVLGEEDHGAIRYRAVNSCIRLAHSIDGMALFTIEDIAGADGALHPAQEAMVQAHGSQCGFCTPGFVMSLFGMYNTHVAHGTAITRAMAVEELSGNLCRCTGYRPILDAAQAMSALPAAVIDETSLLSKLKLLAHDLPGLQPDSPYESPRTLAALLQLRAAHPAAQLVAGCTDVGLWVTKQHLQFERVIDVTKVQALRRIEDYPQHIAIGAAVPLVDACAALGGHWPQLHEFATRFAGLPVRNSGTLGGNVANGSPIGDSMPLLIALRANVVLMSIRGHREMPLEQLYTGYRKNVMAADEVLAWIKVPKPERVRSSAPDELQGLGSPPPDPLPEGEGVKAGREGKQSGLVPSSPVGAAEPALPGRRRSAPSGGSEVHAVTSVGAEFLQVYKISKRFDDDISAVCLAINLQIENRVVTRASIGVGGVAATPVRATKTEAALTGQPWAAATVQRAMVTLRAEFSPISDMRASGDYRREVLGNLLQRYWLESQGLQQINLQSFTLKEAA